MIPSFVKDSIDHSLSEDFFKIGWNCAAIGDGGFKYKNLEENYRHFVENIVKKTVKYMDRKVEKNMKTGLIEEDK